MAAFVQSTGLNVNMSVSQFVSVRYSLKGASLADQSSRQMFTSSSRHVIYVKCNIRSHACSLSGSTWRILFMFCINPWSRVLLEKFFAASQEILYIFFGTRRFFTVLASARHLSLSWADSIQSPHPTSSSWRFILILSSHLRLGKFCITSRN
jgi:hypothetical protein